MFSVPLCQSINTLHTHLGAFLKACKRPGQSSNTHLYKDYVVFIPNFFYNPMVKLLQALEDELVNRSVT